jgi:hypothetical protein
VPLDDVRSPEEVSVFPSSDEERAQILSDARDAFQAAQDARQQHEDEWLRHYRLYRSHVEKNKGDWRSKLFIPYVFTQIETVLPRLVASLPSPIVYPVGPEDTAGAKKMEQVLQWAADRSNLDLSLVQMFWSGLVYGTGVMKIRPGREYADRYLKVPEMEDVVVQVPMEVGMGNGGPTRDLAGAPMMRDAVAGQRPTGKNVTEHQQIDSYVGPYGDPVDIWNVYPAPEAADIQSARYLIHRAWMPRSWVQKRIKDGTFKVGADVAESDLWSTDDDPRFRRLSRVGYGGGRANDRTAKMNQLWDYWTEDGIVTTVLNERWVVRRIRNPYRHGGYPFARIVDHLVPFEFWGIGECATLEALQTFANALWNSRIDQLRMVLNRMFMLDEQAIVDPREITRLRPGGFVRVNNPNGLPIQNIIAPIDFGEVTQSAYLEAQEIERIIERTGAVSGYQTGVDAPSQNDTATGVALISEQGNARFSQKIKMAELTGLRDIMRQYGAVLQQFTPPDMQMRVSEPDGSFGFTEVGSETTEGAFDYSIEAESSTVTESVRRDQALGLAATLAGIPPRTDPMTGGQSDRVNWDAVVEDTVEVFGKRDPARYLAPPAPVMPMLPPELAGLEQEAPVEAPAP